MRMRVYSSNINHIFNDASSTKACILLIDHFLNVARIDNIKHSKN